MTTNYPQVAVVILNWNGRYFLEKFLPSVFNSSYPNLSFVLGDNASTDDSVAFVRECYPTIKIIENGSNKGFAGGYNAVLEQVDADYFVLLNSDVEVTEKWIEPVIEMLERNANMAAAQPKIRALHERSKFEHAGASGGFIDAYGYPFCRGRILSHTEEDTGQYDNSIDVFWATGAALFIKADAWRASGGFDADFFAHMEEIDLCWRLKRMGFRIGVCPSSVVYHVGGGTLNASNPKKTFLNFRNNLMMLQKNLPFWTACRVIFVRLWLDLFALIQFLLKGKFGDAWAISRAHQEFFWYFFRTASKRKKLLGPFFEHGIYKGLIVSAYYFGDKKKFSSLSSKDFIR
ncbi:glycosyltransferase family 2 protein [Sphingobacterium corticibacter]|uniref:Glycosyl transferase family 2 n=1 Tax=Sphingobacterium corticibacter TaxID=2171749 RepID=A0A2T8HI47_9SPHI|nr:glycosyltransferase family 2 protein [Sphingobacterium corticibacter]PVH25085.1 glycosyl transferase family 2 [Sphingobacterium corticibacter]